MTMTVKTWMYENLCKDMSKYNYTPVAEKTIDGYSVEIGSITIHTAKAIKVGVFCYKKAYGAEIDMNKHVWQCWIPKSALV